MPITRAGQAAGLSVDRHARRGRALPRPRAAGAGAVPWRASRRHGRSAATARSGRRNCGGRSRRTAARPARRRRRSERTRAASHVCARGRAQPGPELPPLEPLPDESSSGTSMSSESGSPLPGPELSLVSSIEPGPELSVRVGSSVPEPGPELSTSTSSPDPGPELSSPSPPGPGPELSSSLPSSAPSSSPSPSPGPDLSSSLVAGRWSLVADCSLPATCSVSSLAGGAASATSAAGLSLSPSTRSGPVTAPPRSVAPIAPVAITLVTVMPPPTAVSSPTRGASADAELARDLLVSAALQLAQDDRVALSGRKCRHGGEHVPEALAPFEGRMRRFLSAGMGLERLVVGAALAQDIERHVVGDAEEPAPQRQRRGVAVERAVSVDERLLHRVLAAPVGEDPRAIAEELAFVAHDDRLESPVVSGTSQVDKPRVALRPE